LYLLFRDTDSNIKKYAVLIVGSVFELRAQPKNVGGLIKMIEKRIPKKPQKMFRVQRKETLPCQIKEKKPQNVLGPA
jgi:hypothetical protein